MTQKIIKCKNCGHPIIKSAFTKGWFHEGDVGTGEHMGLKGKFVWCKCNDAKPSNFS